MQKREDLGRRIHEEERCNHEDVMRWEARRDELLTQRNALADEMAALEDDIATLKEETALKQTEYITIMRDKEAIVRDIDNVNKQLRKIVIEQNGKKQQPLVIDMDTDDDNDNVSLAARIKRNVRPAASIVEEPPATDNKRRATESGAKTYAPPIAHLGGDVYVSKFENGLIDIRKWLLDANNEPKTPQSSRFAKSKVVGVTLAPEIFKQLVNKRAEIDSAISAKNIKFLMQMDDGVKVTVSPDGNLCVDKPTGAIAMSKDQWKKLKQVSA